MIPITGGIVELKLMEITDLIIKHFMQGKLIQLELCSLQMMVKDLTPLHTR